MGWPSEGIVRHCPRLAAVALTIAGGASSGCSLLYSTDAISSQTADAGPEGGAGGPSLCDASSFVFCDGLESGFGATPVGNGGGAPTLESARVYRGQFALLSSMPATTAGSNMAAQILASQSWPAHLFVRFFGYLPSPWPVGADLFTALDGTNNGVALYLTENDAALSIINFGPSTNGIAISSTRAPLAQWLCFEMEVDSTGQNVNVWMNGSMVNDLSGATPIGDPQLLSVGLLYDSPPAAWPAVDAWFDEVAVDTSRIGCLR